MSSLLTTRQRELLQSFQDIVQISDEQLAISILQQHRWELQTAVEQYITGGTITNERRNDSSSIGNDYALEEDDEDNQQNEDDNQPLLGTSSVQRRSPRSTTSSHPVDDYQTFHSGRSYGNSTGILDFLFLPLRWLFQVQPYSLDPQQDTIKFIDEYDSVYSSTDHPSFFRGSYQSAVSHAHRTSKFLLVYLHSPLHDDTNRFCNSILTNHALRSLIDRDTIFWAGKVWDAEAYGLSGQLKATSFPFLALLLCENARSVQVIDKIQGLSESHPTTAASGAVTTTAGGAVDIAQELTSRLENGMRLFTSMLEQNRIESYRRLEATRLREQQDREYQESILAEQQQEQQRIEAERARAEAEEQARQAEELARALEMSQELSRQDQLRKWKESFAQYPEPQQSDKQSAAVKFTLPRGKKLERRFLKTEPVQRIFDFLSIHFAEEGYITKNFSVSTNFPKRELTDRNQTIEEVNLYPRGMLFVQDTDA